MTIQMNPGLAELRAELDCIDDQILDLLERRLAASAAVAAAKNAQHGDLLKLRPRRQKQILERLKSRARRAAPELVDRIWREIMSHSLQAQARTELVLAPTSEPDRLRERVRAQFGSAAPIRMAGSTADALAAASSCEVIAIVPEGTSAGLGLQAFEVVKDDEGSSLAIAVGRVAAEDALPETWSPASWRARPAQQLPAYPDGTGLAAVEQRISRSAPLVDGPEIRTLRSALARVAAGDGFLLQGGDCAESFAEFSADKVRSTWSLLLRMGALVGARGESEVVHLARIAGQFAKPRSAATETVNGLTLPSYRGDAVNGPEFTAAARTPQPQRLLEAYAQAHDTVNLIRAYGADRHALPVFTSHEALLLNYEQALARQDVETGAWYATSGHMVWIGDRTRQLDGAHVEFARGVANPIGLKCGPSLAPDDLLRLIDRLDPYNEAGRLVLIGRFGAGNVEQHLPALMRATRDAGRSAIWSVDPMHGNTRTIAGLKTRIVADVIAEIRAFFEVAEAEGVHPGGVHLEMTGSDVTECMGGSLMLAREDLGRSYLTHCDPRLNEAQSLDVAHAVAELLAARSEGRANAA